MAKKKSFMRNPAVTETDIDDEIFLVEPVSEEVFYCLTSAPMEQIRLIV